MKNIAATRLFSQLDAYPSTVKQMETFVEVVDVAKLFSDMDLSQVRSFSPIKLDLIYVILRLSNLVHTRFIASLLEETIIPHLQTTIRCTSLNWYNILFDQMTQDVEYFLHRAVRFCLENDGSVHQYMVSGIVSILEKVSCNSVYQTAFRKLNQKMDKTYFQENESLFHLIAAEVEDEIRGQFSKTMESLIIFAQDALDPEIEDEDAEKIMASLDKIIGLNEVMAQECHELVVYVEQTLANSLTQPDELMLIYQTVSDQGWKIVGRCDARTMEAPLIDHGLFQNGAHLVTALTKMASVSPQSNPSAKRVSDTPCRRAFSCILPGESSRALKSKPIDLTDDTLLYQLVSRYCRVQIVVMEMDQSKLIPVASFGESTSQPIIIYRHAGAYYTLIRGGENFVRAYSQPFDADKVIRKIENARNKIFIHALREEIKHI